MATFDGFGNQIGAFGTPTQAGAMALGRVRPKVLGFAQLVEKGGASAAIALAPRVIAPTQQSAPLLVQGVNPEEGSLPKPVLIGLGVAGVALLGLLAFKLTR
jgi:hypothetical protein